MIKSSTCISDHRENGKYYITYKITQDNGEAHSIIVEMSSGTALTSFVAIFRYCKLHKLNVAKNLARVLQATNQARKTTRKFLFAFVYDYTTPTQLETLLKFLPDYYPDINYDQYRECVQMWYDSMQLDDLTL